MREWIEQFIRSWEFGSGQLKDPSFSVNIQFDATGTYLSASAGHRHVYALRQPEQQVTPEETEEQPEDTEDADEDDVVTSHGARELPVAPLTQNQFDALLDYSSSLPTGMTVGKQWKRRVDYHDESKGWLMGEYVDVGDPDEIGIEWSKIEIVDAAES